MTSTKVKLPSIAELTQSTTPKAMVDTSPLMLINSTPSIASSVPSSAKRSSFSVSSSSSTSPETVSLSMQEHGVQPVGPQLGSSYYDHYSYGLNAANSRINHNYNRPMVSQQPVVNPQNGVFISGHEPNPMFNVPEVINRPMNECHRCGTTETPEWRRGPNGLRTLCNACGLFHAKLVKRKGAAFAAEEVLNNKVYKGKNGRRVCIKRQEREDSMRKMKEGQVTEIPPIPQALPVGFAPPSMAKEGLENGLHQVPRYQHPSLHLQYLNYEHQHPQAPQYRPYTAFLPGFSPYAGTGEMMSSPKLAYPSSSALRQ